MQNCIEHTIKFTKEVNERQTTKDLKDEMYTNFEKHDTNLKEEEKERKENIKKAITREDDIQAQVDKLVKYNKDKVKLDYKMGKDDLGEDKYLNVENNFDQMEEYSEYREPTFESDPTLIDWSQSNLNDPRVLTVKNVRDIFYACLN